MTQLITNINPTTELEAVNEMLATIGESPVDDLSTATQADVALSLNLLGGNTREVQLEGWRFNTEFELQLSPAATMTWTFDSLSAVTDIINIFAPPVNNVGRIRLSDRPDQNNLDVAVRPSRLYTVSTAPVLVFYDRARNCDGFRQAERQRLYVDITWMFDFEMMPESIRRYVTIRSARQLAEKAVNADTISKWTKADELAALRLAKLDQGNKDSRNMLQQIQTGAANGGRISYSPGVWSPRRNWR